MTETTTRVRLDVDLARDADAVREAIIEEAARQLLVTVTPYTDGVEVPTKLAASVREDMSRAVRAEVEKVIGPAVAAALEEGVQLTDTYGSPRGPRMTLREVIIAEAKKVLERKIEVRDNYGRSETVVQQIIRDEVQRALADDLKDAVREERDRVQAAVREHAANIITESVQRAARVHG
jgi:hypothetical protein